MCLAVPVKVVDIDRKKNKATGKVSGVEREIDLGFLDDIENGDYVLLHAGFAIQKVNEKEAKKSLEAWEELENI
ncbi:MAG: HypC/HybG/HupF family hydrogenase formation chaperone [Elusimicrobiota bacterium]